MVFNISSPASSSTIAIFSNLFAGLILRQPPHKQRTSSFLLHSCDHRRLDSIPFFPSLSIDCMNSNVRPSLVVFIRAGFSSDAHNGLTEPLTALENTSVNIKPPCSSPQRLYRSHCLLCRPISSTPIVNPREAWAPPRDEEMGSLNRDGPLGH